MKKKNQKFLSNSRKNSLFISWSERCISVTGIFFCCGLLTLIAHRSGEFLKYQEWIFASIGANAVLIFLIPSSPMAQPRAIILGNIISALVGVSCVLLIGNIQVAFCLSIAISVFLMICFNCLNAPAAATALGIVIGHVSTYRYVLFPVLLDCLILVFLGFFYHSLIGRNYPHKPLKFLDKWKNNPDSESNQAFKKIQQIEIDRVLSEYKEVFDIDRNDLAYLIKRVEFGAYHKKLENMICRSIMSAPVITVEIHTLLENAWNLLRVNHIKSIPVVDKSRQVIGIVTLEDFLSHADIDFRRSFEKPMQDFLSIGATKGLVTSTHYPNAIGQIMKKPVRVISSDRNVMDLAHIFAEQGHHHLPVIDENRHLVGMITQSDFVQAIHESLQKQ